MAWKNSPLDSESGNFKWTFDGSGSPDANTGGVFFGSNTPSEYKKLIQTMELRKDEEDKLRKEVEKVKGLQELIEKTSKELEATQTDLQAMKASLEDQGKELSEAKLDFEKQRKEGADQIKTDRLQSIQILAIFVAFFTFASISFQMFANVNSHFWLPLGLTILGAMTLFSSIIIMASNKVTSMPVVVYITLCFSIICIASGSILYWFALNDDNGRMKECSSLTLKMEAQKEKTGSVSDILSVQQKNICRADGI